MAANSVSTRTLDNFKLTYSFPKKRTSNTIQITFGSMIEGGEDNFNSDLRKFKHSLRQFFYQKSKDGYYKKKFLFIEKENVFLKQKKKGMLFFDVFLYLEEYYERNFIVDYLDTILPEINQIYYNHKQFKFKKFEDAKK